MALASSNGLEASTSAVFALSFEVQAAVIVVGFVVGMAFSAAPAAENALRGGSAGVVRRYAAYQGRLGVAG